jgi:lipopolysaccharide biosynthesis glycosyltransferase
MDLRGKSAAAAPDGVESTEALERATHGIRQESDYFNAGVLLFDLAMWRAEKITDKILSFARTTKAELLLLDQSALNVVLEGEIQVLGKEWNFFYLAKIRDIPDPKIIHYAGPNKPWQLRLSPYYDLYRFHRSHTPWPLVGTPFPPGGRLKMGRRKLGAWFGLDRYRSMQEISGPALKRARSLLGVRYRPA